MKDGFILYTSQYAAIKALSLEQKGRLLDSLYGYAMGEEVDLSDEPAVAMAASFIKERIDYNEKRYQKVCEKRREAIAKRWNKEGKASNSVDVKKNTKDTNVYKPILTDTDTVTEADTDTDTNVSKETYDSNSKDKDNIMSSGEDERHAMTKLCDKIAEMWNTICVDLPKVKSLGDGRRKCIKTRLREWGKNEEERLIKVESLFRAIEASDFLSGRSEKWNGCSFDWLFESPKNWRKVEEGNYANKAQGSEHPAVPKGVKLGVGEFIAKDGTRRYGTGNLAPAPMDAPPRPDNDSIWSNSENRWIPTGC